MRFNIVNFRNRLMLEHELQEWLPTLKMLQLKNQRKNTLKRHINQKRLCWYCTFTFDSKKKDRFDTNQEALTKLLRRYGYHYCLVAEYHDDGAIHYHGFLSDGKDFRYKGVKNKYGKPMFSFRPLQKKYGNTVCYPIINNKTINYVVKYATKQGNKMLYSRIRFAKDSDKKALELFGDKIVRFCTRFS